MVKRLRNFGYKVLNFIGKSICVMKSSLSFFLLLIATALLSAQNISIGKQIFTPQDEHTHGATLVELPDGDILAAWFQGNGERWADDVRIMGSRYLRGEDRWTSPFLMADVPGFPDINPVLFLDARKRLWLVWYTVMANQWETSLLKYRISNDYSQKDVAPGWDWQDVIHVKPGDAAERGISDDDRFIRSVEKQYEALSRQLLASGASVSEVERWLQFRNDILAKARGENMERRGANYPYYRRMGWQTKNKPVQIGNRILLPLYSDGLEMSLFAITDDFGRNWHFSTPLAGIANIQASVATKRNGDLVAYMRDNGPPPKRHPVSVSRDTGLTWSIVQDSELPNPGSGSDVITLSNGHWVIAYNDTEKGRHSLAVSLSTDEGRSWGHTRHLELDRGESPATAAYPSIIQGRGEQIHLVYSHTRLDKQGSGKETIMFATIDEEWIIAGDPKEPSTFRAGAAVRKISPDPLLPVSGGIGTPREVTQQKGDLFVRTLVMEQKGERVAIVNIDNLGWPATLGDRSRALIEGIPPENVLIGATHTHSGPDAYGFPDENGGTKANFAYLDWCVQQVAEAVNEAIQNLEPAGLRIAEGEAKGKIAYNYYAEQLYDPRCNVLQAVSSKSGQVIATLVNYAIHPEVIGSRRGILSPDLCGPLYRRIEERAGGIAVFMNGAQGGMVTADNRTNDNSKDIGTWEECIRIGNLLADEALRILEGAPLQDDPQLQCYARTVRFPVDSEMLRFIFEHSPLGGQLNPDQTVSTRLNLINIGTAQILTIPGEALPNIGFYLKRNMQGRENMLFGLTNDAFGYILTREDFNSFKRYDYVTRTSLGERTGEILVREALDMVRKAGNGQRR